MMKYFSISVLAATLLASLTGCATNPGPGPEEKLGRGLRDTWEVARLGEMRKSVEQSEVFDSPSDAFNLGVIRGFDHTVARVGLGVAEVVTFPFPPYEPVWTSYVKPGYDGPESYKPGLYSDAMFDTDTYTGFSGGDVAPFVPGSRFKIFDN